MSSVYQMRAIILWPFQPNNWLIRGACWWVNPHNIVRCENGGTTGRLELKPVWVFVCLNGG